MSSLNEYGIIPHNEQYKAAEPVAWMVYTQDGKSVYVTDNPTDIASGQRALPLYTSPPADELTRLRAEVAGHERVLTAMTKWLEKNQPDVWRRGIWDDIYAARAALKETTNE